MIIDFSTFKASDYAAWWGATIATLALVWNIVIALRSGARLHVTATANMRIYPLRGGEEDKTYIMVCAVNKGTSATTITQFCGYSADNVWGLFFRGKRKYFIVNATTDTKPIPSKVAPGDEWLGTADQDLMIKGINSKYLYLGISHNQSKRPIYKRVKHIPN